VTLSEAIKNRKTTNGRFLPQSVSLEHQHALIDAACHAPSHFNSQPWRFVLIDNPQTIEKISQIGGESMTKLIESGTFFQRYRKYFRFSQDEMNSKRSGIYVDQMPMALRPFIKQVFSDSVMKVLSKLGVAAMLGQDNANLIQSSPLLLAVLLTKEEYIPGALSGYYCTISMGMAVEHIWLTATDLGMGMQFISTPMEIPAEWQRLKDVLEVPDTLELMAVYRLGYVDTSIERPRIDWKSAERLPLSALAFRNTCTQAEQTT
jgi:nitroreductase